jgi:hypothetical protein
MRRAVSFLLHSFHHFGRKTVVTVVVALYNVPLVLRYFFVTLFTITYIFIHTPFTTVVFEGVFFARAFVFVPVGITAVFAVLHTVFITCTVATKPVLVIFCPAFIMLSAVFDNFHVTSSALEGDV